LRRHAASSIPITVDATKHGFPRRRTTRNNVSLLTGNVRRRAKLRGPFKPDRRPNRANDSLVKERNFLYAFEPVFRASKQKDKVITAGALAKRALGAVANEARGVAGARQALRCASMRGPKADDKLPNSRQRGYS
jgi:hypothetical protein